MFKLSSIKFQLILYLGCFAIFLAVKDRNATFLLTTIIALVSAVTIESIILYFKKKLFQVTESSIITGLIVGYVLSSDEIWWKFSLAASLAIFSKYLIRFRKKHIFNPAAFGIFLTLVIFGASTQWDGTYVWYVLLPFGIYFVQKIKKIEVIIGYFLVSLILFGIQAILQSFPLWDIFGFLSYFYIFVMIIEPVTSPVSQRGKYLFGACLAGIIFTLTEFGVKFDIELFSLLFMNAFVPILNKLSVKKGESL